jgi:hypothetical protein
MEEYQTNIEEDRLASFAVVTRMMPMLLTTQLQKRPNGARVGA